ncbi:MAG: O-antigen ligase family protein [Pyrinomonadaceae bacterium]
MSLSLFLCLLSFAVCYLFGKRSLIGGLISVFAIGYVYGIGRANVEEALSHFIFDAGVLGFYCAQLFRHLTPAVAQRVQSVRPWLEFLIIWPLLLFLIPNQDTLIRFVGLRGNIFLLPFILIGARLVDEEKYDLAIGLAILNIGAFVVASVEFFTTIETFFPRNEVTRLIYLSRDVAQNAYRIPSTFSGAHAYAGTMVVSLPFLLGAFQQKKSQLLHKPLLVVGLIVSLLGVLLAATRVHFIAGAILVIIALISVRSRLSHVLAGILILAGIGWWVSGEQRLQRFTGLQDVEMVSERVAGSVNLGFLDLAVDYPFGNGLGGGGTSIPYFLSGRIENPVGMENEYARIMLEQGLVGLALWIAFIAWLLMRRGEGPADPWFLGRRLAWAACAAYFATGLIGTGLLTSLPQTCLFLLNVGWVASRQLESAAEERLVPAKDLKRYTPSYEAPS